MTFAEGVTPSPAVCDTCNGEKVVVAMVPGSNGEPVEREIDCPDCLDLTGGPAPEDAEPANPEPPPTSAPDDSEPANPEVPPHEPPRTDPGTVYQSLTDLSNTHLANALAGINSLGASQSELRLYNAVLSIAFSSLATAIAVQQQYLCSHGFRGFCPHCMGEIVANGHVS